MDTALIEAGANPNQAHSYDNPDNNHFHDSMAWLSETQEI